jgi:hypothetical protein
MKKLTILSISSIILLSFMFIGLADAAPPYKKYLTTIHKGFMMTPDEGYAWHVFKAEGGPTYAGSPAWKRYVEFLEAKLREFGVVDIMKNSWTYDRYFVDDWPLEKHASAHQLVSDGTPVPVATFGMCSGFTSPDGMTYPMVYHDATTGQPAEGAWQGKIAVMKTIPHPNPPYTNSYITSYTFTDSEYYSDPRYFPLFQYVPPSVTNSFNNRYVHSQMSTFRNYAIRGKAKGMVVVYDLPWGSAVGLYQRTTEYDCPTLALDRVNGAKVLEDAKAGKMAKLTLLAQYIPSEPYNFVGYLPGKNYGTANDEKVLIANHTDAMSLTQDNGALGTLGVVRYFSRIPQSERPRTLMVFIDCRHFMPGAESTWVDEDMLFKFPELREGIIANIGLEHMGELEGIEIGDEWMLSGRPAVSWIGMIQGNDFLIDTAIKAVKDNNWPNAEIKCSRRLGIQGGIQANPRTAQYIGGRYDPPIPGGGLAADWVGSHCQSFAGIERFDKNLFYTQVAGMSQIIGNLMLVAPVVLDYVWGDLNVMIRDLPDNAFRHEASLLRKALLNKDNAVFNQVRIGDYKGAIQKLENDLKKHIMSWIVPANQAALIEQVDLAIEKLLQAK